MIYVSLFVNIRSLPTEKPGFLVHEKNPQDSKLRNKQEHFSHRKSYYCLIHFFWQMVPFTYCSLKNCTTSICIKPCHSRWTTNLTWLYIAGFLLFKMYFSTSFLVFSDVKFLTPLVSPAGGARLFPYGSSVTRNLEALAYQTLGMLR